MLHSRLLANDDLCNILEGCQLEDIFAHEFGVDAIAIHVDETVRTLVSSGGGMSQKLFEEKEQLQQELSRWWPFAFCV